MAEYDIPAMLEHALKVSGQTQLFYIGHSQGTLVGFTGFSANPELAKKVKLFIALAPIFFLTHTATILRDVAFTLNPIEVWAGTTHEGYYSLGRSTKKEYLSVIETFRENKESNRKCRTSHPTTRQNSSYL